MASADIRRRFVVTGQVQGVGFRPFIFRLAEELTDFLAQSARLGDAIGKAYLEAN